MVRYSVTMDDELVRKIDRDSKDRGISRSDWISEVCTTHFPELDGSGISQMNREDSVHFRHNITDYDETYNSFSIDVPEYYNFSFDVVDAWAKRDRNKLAMIWANQQGEERKYTFRDLSRLSNQVANMLIKYGPGKGERVLIMLPRVPEWWFFVLGMIKMGVVYCPAPTMLTEQDLKYRINVADVKMVITNEENAHKVDAIFDECPSLVSKFIVDGEREGWISYPVELAYPAPVSSKLVPFHGLKGTKATDPMLIFFTSGTTGEPKMVLHDHSYALGHIVTGRFWHDVRSTDLHFTVADTGWGKSTWGKLFGQWNEGAAIMVYDIRGKFNATGLLPVIEKYGVTTFCVPPTIYRMLILAELEKYDFSELRHCCSAGEPLNPEVIKVWKKATGLTIYEGYGQTETVLCIGTFPCMESKPGSMGKPAPGWHIEIHNDEGKPAPPHEEGHIAIKTDPRPVGLFQEYIGNAGENAKSFSDGYYYTGDKAYKDEDGYFWFVGRDDDVIKASGYRIGPFEVESALIEHPAVQEAAVVGTPDVIRGQIVKAFVVLSPGYTPSEALIHDIQNHVKQVTAPYKYPRAIEFVEGLPKTISGKIRRKELKQREMEKAERKNKDIQETNPDKKQ
ncbi:AMP-binding protein [Methanogenium sp. MK-MG]|uniref:AMP-binding protein n=1 Tax=Methanogenium sp. MK-MG TaxID=2599926 RepID=UPI0013EBADD2|nr:AMP-binding protein [Methanogenium sp. MK-MG]KAF1078376.1 4-hydroxybutyrate--CoA ligase 1 [Methanogenium sp. MK-MG]